jgi:membrane-associated phospholipid phosphatase
MQDHLAADANEQVMIEPAPRRARPARPARVRIARLVSNTLAPPSISLPFILLVALYHAPDTRAALFYGFVTLLFLCIGPLLYVLIGVRLGKLSDIEISLRTERAKPFLFSISSVLAGWLVLLLLHGPRNLQTVMMITAVSGVVMMVITLWWKISIHASSMAGAATMLTTLYGGILLPTFALVVLVCWSRVALGRHTVSQVVAGALMSISLTLLLLNLRGI